MEKKRGISLSACLEEVRKQAQEYEQRRWELYCTNVKNGMLAPDALERATSYLEYYMNPK